MYYMDYLRVYAYNFHIKDFKDRVEDNNDSKIGGGDRGNQSWKKDKKQKIESDDVVIGSENVMTTEEVSLDGDAVALGATSSTSAEVVVEDLGSHSGI